jgi:hypothetical protein
MHYSPLKFLNVQEFCGSSHWKFWNCCLLCKISIKFLRSKFKPSTNVIHFLLSTWNFDCFQSSSDPVHLPCFTVLPTVLLYGNVTSQNFLRNLVLKDGCLLDCFATQSGRSLLMFQECLLLPSSGPDDGGRKHLWNVGKLLLDYTAQQSRRQPSSHFLQWQPQIILSLLFLHNNFSHRYHEYSFQCLFQTGSLIHKTTRLIK